MDSLKFHLCLPSPNLLCSAGVARPQGPLSSTPLDTPCRALMPCTKGSDSTDFPNFCSFLFPSIFQLRASSFGPSGRTMSSHALSCHVTSDDTRHQFGSWIRLDHALDPRRLSWARMSSFAFALGKLVLFSAPRPTLQTWLMRSWAYGMQWPWTP
jgi:hypothetical protein